MDQLETEKRTLQMRMDPQDPQDPLSAPSSIPGPPSAPMAMGAPMEKFSSSKSNGDTASNLANHIRMLKAECNRYNFENL